MTVQGQLALFVSGAAVGAVTLVAFIAAVDLYLARRARKAAQD